MIGYKKMKKILVFSLIILVILGIFAAWFKWDYLTGFLFSKSNLSANLAINQTPEQKPRVKEATLIAVGDIMLTRGVAIKIAKNGSEYPFLQVKDYLKTGDIVFGNLETPISPGRAIKPGEMLFRSDPGLEKELRANNFSILSLANNHTENFGDYGLEQTFKYLDEAGIKYIGAGENINQAYSPVITDANGLKFAFLAYDDIDFTPASYEADESSAGIAFMDEEKMVLAINEAKKLADFVIVSMHSGIEYKTVPSDKQKEFARLAIDSGAEMVIGHHPHVVESMEKYNGKYIFYSLGNFIFDQMWSLPTRQGAIAKIVFDKSGVKSVETQAILIEDYCQPRITTGEEAQEVLNILTSEKIL
ncbi:MAG: CapA family protein [Candidatus Paceibacterota bacterium]